MCDYGSTYGRTSKKSAIYLWHSVVNFLSHVASWINNHKNFLVLSFSKRNCCLALYYPRYWEFVQILIASNKTKIVEIIRKFFISPLIFKHKIFWKCQEHENFVVSRIIRAKVGLFLRSRTILKLYLFTVMFRGTPCR